MIICGTGHRPTYNYDYTQAKRSLKAFLDLSAPRVTSIISGMADGWDTILAKAALHYEIPLHCYIPYSGQKPTSDEYDSILEGATAILYLSESYYKKVFLHRDEAMVNDADLVLAFWNPAVRQGGTYYTYNYARKNNKPIINFFLESP